MIRLKIRNMIPPNNLIMSEHSIIKILVIRLRFISQVFARLAQSIWTEIW